jgi:D-alanyl-D-alanine-carboxypeptidase/D-alanyl-D-alanine-endopeptidase
VRRSPCVRPAAFLLWTLSALATAPLGAAARQTDGDAFPSDSAVLAILKERVEQKRSAGIVVGMLEPDGRTRIVAWGDPGPGRPALDGTSVFEIGSITKVFTATVLADMVLRRQVSLDDPVQKYLPADRVTMPTRGGKQITLGMLSEQNSGLPRMPSNFQPADPANPYADYTVDQLYAFLSGYELPRDPGASFEYSNLGVGLLGHVLALRAGMPYEDLVRTRVLEPLGMTHTAITLTPWMKDHLALGHDEQGNVVPNWDIAALAGAGAIRSTAMDMLKFLSANLHPERGPLEKAMAFAHEERAPAGAPTVAIGLNWISLHAGSDTIVWHNGGTGGYRTYAGIVPSRNVGVVVLTNSGGAGADDIGMHLLSPQIPLAPPPAPRKEFAAIELPAAVLTACTGTYELAPQFSIEVTLDGDALWAQATGQGKFRLWPYTETDFFIKEVDAQITFEKDAGGRVTGMVLHQNGQDRPGRKIR